MSSYCSHEHKVSAQLTVQTDAVKEILKPVRIGHARARTCLGSHSILAAIMLVIHYGTGFDLCTAVSCRIDVLFAENRLEIYNILQYGEKKLIENIYGINRAPGSMKDEIKTRIWPEKADICVHPPKRKKFSDVDR